MKKGQMSYFFLIALIVLISSSFILYVNNNQKAEIQPSKLSETDYKQFANYVEECVKLSAKEAVLDTAFQGGYYNETSNSIIHSFFIIPLYSKGNSKLTPSIQKLEEQISLNADENIIRCVDDFKILKEKGFETNFEKPTSKARILPSHVLFDVTFPINVKTGSSTKSYSSFSAAIPSRYSTVYLTADKISGLLANNPAKLCVSCLVDYAYLNELNISVVNFGKDSILITIVDDKVKIDNKNVVFNFAHSIGGLDA
ncbi:hypothetical protein HYW20_04905 [Candidatus Woesearchaeota archaeon]|nr:hypothetical protein [Candidatus Woesearchaeota archaeon]